MVVTELNFQPKMKYASGLLSLLLISSMCNHTARDEVQNSQFIRLYEKSIKNYIGKPVKKLILESKYKLTNIGYDHLHGTSNIDGLFLTFANRVTLIISFDELRYLERHSENAVWDLNKCVLEKAYDICVYIPKDTSYYFPSNDNVSIQFISKDSIIINHKWLSN